MKYRTRRSCCYFSTVLFGTAVLSGHVYADDVYPALQKEVQALRQEVAELRTLLKQQRAAQDEVKDRHQEVKATSSPKSEPASPDMQSHLAGYAAVGFTSRSENGSSAFNAARFNPIFHVLYKDKVLAEAELEVATAPDGSTETKLEYASIDVFLNNHLTLVAGKFLSPLGYFRQNLHPAWINKFPSIAPGFGEGQAAPSSEVGLGVRGGYPFGGDKKLKYALYAGNGPELEAESGEIHGVESDGFTRDVDRRKVIGGRLGVCPHAPSGIWNLGCRRGCGSRR